MTTHLENKTKSGAYREDGFMWRYAALCGVTFIGGDPEHTLVNPGDSKFRELTCTICAAINTARTIKRSHE